MQHSSRATERAENPAAGAAAQRIGAGFATSGDLARHLAIGSRQVPLVVQSHGLVANAMGRFAWESIWRIFWQIRDVPPSHFSTLKRPALTNSDLAGRYGVCAKTIRRHSAGGTLPPCLDLSARIRRHLPLRVELWESGTPLPDWLRPKSPKSLFLTPRRGQQGAKVAIADKGAGNGKQNDHRLG